MFYGLVEFVNKLSHMQLINFSIKQNVHWFLPLFKHVLQIHTMPHVHRCWDYFVTNHLILYTSSTINARHPIWKI